ncbi:hypothetical protein E2C01_099251 [Portunus trituberculatus]|uniref:Uncharacterized protein n=1 Tax=Portunus trituberculatus TaxID=210409 RepID=A0A5B7KEY6_PORTR|nr:hypothetical protein [Portunus trituberculatus]
MTNLKEKENICWSIIRGSLETPVATAVAVVNATTCRPSPASSSSSSSSSSSPSSPYLLITAGAKDYRPCTSL